MNAQNNSEFVARHIGPDAVEQAQMLAFLGVESKRQLLERVIPSTIRRADRMGMPSSTRCSNV